MKTEKEPLYKIPEIGLYGHIKKASFENRPKIQKFEKSYHILKSVWDENNIDVLEEFKIILLEADMTCMAVAHLSYSRYGRCIVEPRQIFSMAFKYYAIGIILAHNHPDGSLIPRKSDIDFTEQMVLAGSILNLPVHDHLILSSKGYLSFAEEKIMPQPM